MKIKVVAHIEAEALGDCHGFPYRMDSVAHEITFWTGSRSPASALPQLHDDVLPRARQVLDIDSARACDGNPTGFITPRLDIP